MTNIELRYDDLGNNFIVVYLKRKDGEIRIGGIANQWSKVFIDQAFKELTPIEQQEIAAQLKKEIISPEQLAELNWKRTSKNQNIARLREELVVLKTPSTDLDYYSTSHKVGRMSSSSPDERRGPVRYEEVVTTYKLLVGFKKPGPDRRNVLGYPSNFHSIETFTYRGLTDDLDRCKEELLRKKEEEFQKLISSGEETIVRELHPLIYDNLTPEQWNQRYQNKFQELRQETLAQWEAEDQAEINRQGEEIKEYHRLAGELQALSSQAEEKRKEFQGITRIFDYSRIPYFSFDSLDTMRKSISDLNNFLQTLEQRLSEYLQKTGEQLPPSEPVPVVKANWFLYNVQPDELVKMGLELNQGAEGKAAGKHKLIPGDKPVVALRISGGSVKRYSVENFRSQGIEPFSDWEGRSIGGRDSALIIGMVTDSNWSISWDSYEKGDKLGTNTADKSGINSYYGSKQEWNQECIIINPETETTDAAESEPEPEKELEQTVQPSAEQVESPAARPVGLDALQKAFGSIAKTEKPRQKSKKRGRRSR